jgi:magnesium-dependent phosphatase-1
MPNTPIAMDEFLLLPSMVILDLDFTVWPFDCGRYIQGPFTLTGWGIVDKYYNKAEPFVHIRAILAFLVDNDVPIAICSRNPDTTSIESLMRCIQFNCKRGLISMWDAIPADRIHAYSSDGTGGKNKHFNALVHSTGLDLSKALFFDDLQENIVFARQRGVTSVHLSTATGLNWSMMRLGLQRFAAAAAATASLATACDDAEIRAVVMSIVESVLA